MKNPAVLAIASFVLFLATLFSYILFIEYPVVYGGIAALFFGSLFLLAYRYRKSLKGRSAAYTLNTVVTVILVIGIIGVLNFLASRYPKSWDLTRSKIHTLSDQTVKVVSNLKNPVQANFFGKIDSREKFGPLLERMGRLSPKFQVTYLDPDKEISRAKQSGIQKYNTLQLVVQVPGGGMRDQKVEEPTEEKITNTLIKLLKEHSPTLCSINGHGEKSFEGSEADSFASMKSALGEQSYIIKEINLIQEGKIPDSCSAIAILGPKSSFLAPELKILSDYLANGGRAIIALDLSLKGIDPAPELLQILDSWYVRAPHAMIIDPFSRAAGVDASAPLIASYSKDHPITRDFRATNASLFPFTRPLEILPGAPAGLTIQWLGQTTASAFAISNFKQIATGSVSQDQAEKRGAMTVALSIEGKQKDSKASRNTRMVVFGTAQFATNNYGRFGGNADFFLNAVSWTLEDESLISIRSKDDESGRIELSQKSGQLIALLTVLVIPLLIAAGGVAAWVIRKRL